MQERAPYSNLQVVPMTIKSADLYVEKGSGLQKNRLENRPGGRYKSQR